MSRSASRKRARDMKNPVIKGAKLRDLAFKSEMKELSRIGMSERPAWLPEYSAQPVGGDRAVKSGVRQTASEKGRNRHIRKIRDDVRNSNGVVIHTTFRRRLGEDHSSVSRPNTSPLV